MSLGPALNITVVVSIVVTTIALLLRLYVRLFLLGRLRADDYLIIFCQVIFVAFLYCVLQQVKYGVGKHIEEVILIPENVSKILLFYFIGNNFLFTALCIVKNAIATFFLSLNPPRPLRIAAIVLIILAIATCLSAELYHILHCAPVSYSWTRWDGLVMGKPTTGNCLEGHNGYIVNQALNSLDVFGDFALAILPVFMVWRMNLRKTEKCGVALLLGLGAFSAISPLIRAFYLRDFFTSDLDITYYAAPVVMCATTEVGFAITVVCIAQLRPLMRKIFSGSWSSIPDPAADITPTFGQGCQRLRPQAGALNELEVDLSALESGNSNEKEPDLNIIP